MHDPQDDVAPTPADMFREYGGFVCRSLRHLGVQERDLDDMLQEVFVVVCQRLDSYEEQGRARAWLYSICTRLVRAQRRKLGRRKESDQPSEEISNPTQFEHIQDREALQLGQGLLQKLPVDQREVFVLYEVEDMPMSEIAQALSCPLQTAYSRLYKARKRILAEVGALAAKGEL